MPLNWSSTYTPPEDGCIKVCVFSQSGAGKTVLCATAPDPIILSAEAGLLSLQKQNLQRLFGKKNPEYVRDIPVLEIKSIRDLQDAHKFLLTQKARDKVRTVCLDSLTEISEKILQHEKANNKDGRKAFGETIDKTLELIRDFRDLSGYHVYMSAKMEMVKDELEGGMKYNVAMPGSKLGPQIPYFFDEVFYLGRGESEGKKYRFLRTDSDDRYAAKDRSGTLDEIEKPDLSYIFNKILGG